MSTSAQARLLIRSSGAFDPQWYAARLPPKRRPTDLLGHYMKQGWRDGRDPGPHFSTQYYWEQIPDLRATGVNPLVHYLTTGWRFGLLPYHGFQPPAEAAALPEVCPLRIHIALADPIDAGAMLLEDADRWPSVRDRVRCPATEPPGAIPLRTVAFYLPQFHVIPENDRWWGAGFTEWTNVRRGEPRYEGHYQPHVPGDLGYYDLTDPDVFRRQIDLAKRHGISAFCLYTYWFEGKQLLQKPMEALLADPTLDMPFCLCWANENWTRTWDGLNGQVLIGQNHSTQDDLAFIAAMGPYLRDPRYLRVAGRPVLLVYRPGVLPNPRDTAQRWREWCRKNGIGEILLAYVQSFDLQDPADFGMDFAIEFPPSNMAPAAVNQPPTTDEFSGNLLDWRGLSHREPGEVDYPLWKGVTPSWDNEARRPARGTSLVGANPKGFELWLRRQGQETLSTYSDPEQRLVWINAWNEWAEGAHLEPDSKYGYEWLHAVRDAQERIAGITAGTGPGVVVIAHDLQRNGAQQGALALARELAGLGRRVEIVACAGGPLANEAARIAPIHVLDDNNPAARTALARELLQRGFQTALANSAVTGYFAETFHDLGGYVVGLVHELPGVLAAPGRTERAQALADSADVLVFPAEKVRQEFPLTIGPETDIRIQPQGLYMANRVPTSGQPRDALRDFLGIPHDSHVILGVGYGDYRKGLDVLIAALGEPPLGEKSHLVWLGNVDNSDPRIVTALNAAPPGRLHCPGFVTDSGMFYAGADVLALPSREDPFPSVTLEALNFGLPVVAAEGCTGQDQLIRNAAGILIDSLTSGALAQGLATAVAAANPEEARYRKGLVDRQYSFRRYAFDLIAGTPAAIPRVSVVVPNYNYGHLIADRLKQISGQTFPVYEVVVLDDASTDDSLDQITALMPDYPLPISLLAATTNSGSVYTQWATGVAACRGDLVWIAEADDVADPEFLAEVVSPMLDSEVMLSYCESRQINQAGVEIAPHYQEWSDLGVRDYTRRYVTSGLAEISDCLAVKNTIPNASAVVMRREPLQNVLATQSTKIAAQQPTTGDWWVYLQLLGSGRISFSPRALNAHRRHESSVIANADASAHFAEIRRVHATARDLLPASEPPLTHRQQDMLASLM